MILNYSIKKISANETHIVRHPVLREGKPIESCIFKDDELKTTIHLGLFSNEKLVGVCTLLQNVNAFFSDTNQFQLRGMAILKEFQGKGLGQLLLSHAESELKKMRTTLLWCNAREKASSFYKTNGFQVIGQPFNIEFIGIHYVMFKTLENEMTLS